MEKFDPIDIEFLINSKELKVEAKKVKDEIHGIGEAAEKAAGKVGGKGGQWPGIGAPLKDAGDAAEKAGKKAGASKAQWNGLGNSINQISREIPAFTYSAQTGFLALSNNIPILADEIARLKAQNQALVASGQKGVPVWKQVVKGLLSWQTALSLGVAAITIFGPKLFEMIGNLFKGKEAIDEHKASVEALNKAYESSEYQKVIKDMMELRSMINLAKEGVIDKKVALEKYNDSMGEVYKKTDDLNEAERIMIEKAPAYIEAMLYKAAATQATADAAKRLAENQRKQSEVKDDIGALEPKIDPTPQKQSVVYGTGFTVPSQNEARKEMLAGLNKDLNELEEEATDIQSKSAKIVEDLNRKAAEISKAAGLNIFDDGKDKPGGNKLVNDRKKLLEKIADLDREYARKQLDRDAEELQALRDKFQKVRDLIEEFNKDPKNKGRKIDVSGLGVIQDNAEADLVYKQETRALKEELEKRKDLYREIEEYKATFGAEKAQDKYGEELREFETYAQNLKAVVAKNEEAFKAVQEGTATGGQIERVKLLKEASAQERRLQNQKYQDLLASLMSFEQQRNLVIEKYQAKRKELVEKGNLFEAEELDRQHQETLSKMDETYAKGTKEYRDLIRGVEGLSETAARAVVANARKMVQALLEAGRLSADSAREINQKINSLENSINSGESDKLQQIHSQVRQIAGAFYELGDAVGYFDEGLGDTLTTMGELTDVAGNAAMAVMNFSQGNIIGGITSTISAISGLFRIGAKSRESERKAREELLKINQRIEDGERRINEILRQRNIQRAREIELTLKGIEAQREALSLAQSQNQEEQTELLRQLQQSKFISGSHTEKYGGFLGIGRKTRVVNEYATMLGMTFEQIEALFEQGKLEGRAAELFEQLRDLRNEGEDINQMLSDLKNQAQEVFTGTTSSAIADSIIEGLRQGHDSFEDFAGDIEGMLQGAILNAIKYQTLEEPLKQLYEQFAQYAESEGELTEAEADAIRRQYQAQVQNALDQYEQWSQILDEDLMADEDTQKGLQGAIRREMTEETASELTGLFRGQYDITKRHFQLHERHFEIDQRNLEATRNIMQISSLIEQNTAATVVQLVYAVAELKTISKQTKSSQSSRDLGK